MQQVEGSQIDLGLYIGSARVEMSPEFESQMENGSLAQVLSLLDLSVPNGRLFKLCDGSWTRSKSSNCDTAFEGGWDTLNKEIPSFVTGSRSADTVNRIFLGSIENLGIRQESVKRLSS